jgi:hypothetical protein
MLDRARSWLGTLADVVALLLVCPLVFNFLQDTFTSQGWWVGILASLLGLLAVISLAGFTRDRYKKTVAELRDKQIIADVKKIEGKNSRSIKTLLPAEKLLRRWVKSLDEKARLWADDVSEGAVHFYLDVGEQAAANIQVFYFSAWKKIGLTLYCGSFSAQNMEEKEDPHPFIGHKPFYDYSSWRRAVLKAYDKVAEHLPEEYKMSIMSAPGAMVINFRFEQGKVNKQYSFEFDGKLLKREADRSEVEVG